MCIFATAKMHQSSNRARFDAEKLSGFAIVIENRHKIDCGLSYEVTLLDKRRRLVGRMTVIGVSPESVGAWMDWLKAHADAGDLPEYTFSREDDDSLWRGIPTKNRLTLRLGRKGPADLNKNLRGFSVQITFTLPY